MENALALAKVMGPMYVIFGLSVLIYLPSWRKLLDRFVDDHFSAFTLFFVMGVLGLVSVNMYNVWEWNVWLLVTLTGWALIVKSAFYMLLPGNVVKKVLAAKKYNWLLVLDGILALVLGCVLGYYAFWA